MASEIHVLCKCAEFDNKDPSEKQSFDPLKFEHYGRHGPTRPLDVNVPTDFVALRLLYRIALSLCVKTASAERGFSKLAIVKNKLRSTMSQDRLESLVNAAAEKDLHVMIPVDDLVARFAASVDRHLELA